MLNLNDDFVRQKLVNQLYVDLDKFCIDEFKEEPRNHLGASILGNDCKAQIWGVFRWLKQESLDGRQYRLFNRGHLEETRFVRWLRGIGFVVEEFDEDGKQFRISGVNGHFGGSLDGRAWREDTGKLLVEFKTHNDRSFQKLKKEKLRKAKPVHYAQMCSYGVAKGFDFGLYMAVNKNDDEIYIEINNLERDKGDFLFARAENIINSQTQPQKIAQTETYFECKYCSQKGICFRGEAPDINCRSCRNAFPVENASWACAVHNAIIPEHIIKVGCSSYTRII